MEEENKQQLSGNDFSKSFKRDEIAKYVTALAFIGTFLIVLFAIIIGSKITDSKEQIMFFQYSVGVLMPLWGTWMGTVMAFYFSKENLDAAYKTVAYLTDKMGSSAEKLEKLKSFDESIKNFQKLEFENEEELKNQTILELWNKMKELKDSKGNAITRLPIVDKKNLLLYIVHGSTFKDFISEQVFPENRNIEVDKLTFNDMLTNGSAGIKEKLSQCRQFVSKTSNLKEAKEIMDRIKFCKDVFVTEHGRSDEPVLGWITDSLLVEKGTV